MIEPTDFAYYRAFMERHGIKGFVSFPIPSALLDGGMTMPEYLTLEPYLYIPQCEEFPEPHKSILRNISGNDDVLEKPLIMDYFFMQISRKWSLKGASCVVGNSDENGMQIYGFPYIAEVIQLISDEAVREAKDKTAILELSDTYNGKEHNEYIIKRILEDSSKVNRLRPWLNLPAWTIEQFCYMLDEQLPSDASSKLNQHNQAILQQAAEISYVNAVDKERGLYNASDLITLAEDVGLEMPVYMPLVLARKNAKKKEPQDTQKHLREVLNPNHPWHSSELASAVRCWLDMFVEGKYNPGLTTKPQLIDWAKQDNSSKSVRAVERLASVVMPDSAKRGGAS